jgi:NADPH:quinone reductase-like Zn-dependent oxidoreductase
VNPVDWKIARGDLFPMLSAQERTGYDVAGVVDAVGDGVTRFKKGDAVWGDIAPRIGTYAEYVVADDQNLDFKPEQSTFVEAAAVPLAALTAFQVRPHFPHSFVSRSHHMRYSPGIGSRRSPQGRRQGPRFGYT